MVSKLLTTTAIVTVLAGTMLPSISSAGEDRRGGISMCCC
jgi:hypothetical protein